MNELDTDIESIAKSIWASFFASELEPCAPEMPGIESTVTSAVMIDGAWRGTMALECSKELAAALTKEMFRIEVDPSPDDIRDALGELANIACGNVKSLLPGPSTVSLPVVAIGARLDSVDLDTAPISTLLFSCGGQPFRMTLLEHSLIAKDLTS